MHHLCGRRPCWEGCSFCTAFLQSVSLLPWCFSSSWYSIQKTQNGRADLVRISCVSSSFRIGLNSEFFWTDMITICQRLQEVFCLRYTLFSLMVPTPGHIYMPHHSHFESSRSCIAKTPFLISLRGYAGLPSNATRYCNGSRRD